MKRLMILFLALVVIGIFGCGSKNIAENQPHYTIYADDRFTESEKNDIAIALETIMKETNGIYQYDLEFRDAVRFGREMDTGIVYVYAEDPGNGLAGWTAWNAERNGAWMKIVGGMNDKIFIAVMIHELFHSTHIVHYFGEYKSIMRPTVGEDSKIECMDLKRFCVEWHCSIQCTLEEDHNYIPSDAVIELNECRLYQ